VTVLNVMLQCLIKWFAPILSFTTEEIYKLTNKSEEENSIHLKNFVEIPENWKDEELNTKWEKIKKIRDEANISIEAQRAEKIIGSSLEANIQIKIKEEIYNVAKNEDFAEICITSSASILKDDNIKNDIQVNTQKAVGNKCPVCWKISENDCKRHSHLKL
jgi:isoleucyl-tRNA synthetase